MGQFSETIPQDPQPASCHRVTSSVINAAGYRSWERKWILPYTGPVPSTHKTSHRPPEGAAEGTLWFGGPVDRFRITLRIYGEEPDPDQISALFGCAPTVAERKGLPLSMDDDRRIATRGRWSLTIESKDCDERDDLEDGVKILLARLPSDTDLWASLTSTFKVDVFCGIFMASSNRGFGISAEVSRLLSDRHLNIGFDLYFDPPE